MYNQIMPNHLPIFNKCMPDIADLPTKYTIYLYKAESGIW